MKLSSRMNLQLEYDVLKDVGSSRKTGAGNIDSVVLGLLVHLN